MPSFTHDGQSLHFQMCCQHLPNLPINQQTPKSKIPCYLNSNSKHFGGFLYLKKKSKYMWFFDFKVLGNQILKLLSPGSFYHDAVTRVSCFHVWKMATPLDTIPSISNNESFLPFTKALPLISSQSSTHTHCLILHFAVGHETMVTAVTVLQGFPKAKLVSFWCASIWKRMWTHNAVQSKKKK